MKNIQFIFIFSLFLLEVVIIYISAFTVGGIIISSLFILFVIAYYLKMIFLFVVWRYFSPRLVLIFISYHNKLHLITNSLVLFVSWSSFCCFNSLINSSSCKNIACFKIHICNLSSNLCLCYEPFLPSINHRRVDSSSVVMFFCFQFFIIEVFWVCARIVWWLVYVLSSHNEFGSLSRN